MNSKRNPKENIIKLILLGDAGIGKTSIVRRYIFNKFAFTDESTIGASFFQRIIKYDHNNKEYNINLHIWDTAGQERFRSIVPMYIKGAKVCLLTFDLTSKFLDEYFKEWNRFIEQNRTDKMLIYFVGTKSDLIKDDIHINKYTKFDFINKNNIFFVSSKTGEGIQCMKSIKKY